MDRHEKEAQLKAFIDDYLRSQGIELVDLIYRYGGRDLVLRILADRPQGGITLDDCAYLNSEIGRIMDEKNILEEYCILEVASPGLDRSLKTKSDFLRNLNKKVKLFLSEKINSKMELDGDITGATDTSVYIDIKGEKKEIPLSKIIKGKHIF